MSLKIPLSIDGLRFHMGKHGDVTVYRQHNDAGYDTEECMGTMSVADKLRLIDFLSMDIPITPVYVIEHGVEFRFENNPTKYRIKDKTCLQKAYICDTTGEEKWTGCHQSLDGFLAAKIYLY